MWTSSNNYSFDPDFIDRETVIVLGAGASCHLGFPLGSELIRNIIRNTNEQRSKLFTYLEAMGFSIERIREFNRVLQESNSGSIDAFLADYHSFLDIGRASIAAEIINHEVKEKLAGPDNWYNLLRPRILALIKQNMPLPAFISFNYDRSFDTFLSDIFRLEFSREDLQISNPVLHVHGRLGYLDSDYTKQFRRPYNPHATPDEIRDSASGIRVISELGNDYGQEMNQAQEEIKKAKRVTFLGFGYDRTNLYRLLKCIESPWQERGKFFGTAFKLGSERIAELMKQTEGRLALAESDTTIRSFLARSKVPIL